MTRISLDQVETSERFYRIPKVFTEETSYYSLMSLEAKFAYGLLKDRFELSIKNKWIDKNGFVYLNFTVESLANVLSCGAKKAIRIKKELTAYGLLEEERPGCNKPNRLYVLNVDSTRKCQNDNTNKVSDSKEVSKRQFKNGQNDTSRNGEMTIQEVSKRQPNDTEYNDTDFIDTKSEDEEEKIKKENLNESQEQDWKQAVKNKKREILQKFGELIGQSLIDEAVDNTSNNLFDISYYDSYLFVALQKAIEKYQKLIVEPQKELSETIVSFSPSLLNPDNFK
ncbi:replication initiator protein A [Lactococcus garvieae]|uniref:replication initiator protein A n=1 Tax=Lactococcus garvieae TaxID=1363 RepID=UPI002551BC3A|nr:replication initiator protein A [Lactococcus garvieae]